MACIDFNDFKRFILAIDQSVEIDKLKDKPLRYDVWNTTQEHVSKLTKSGTMPEIDTSIAPRIERKLKAAWDRVNQSSKKGGTTQRDIFDNADNIEMTIALHELMESVKGEADKARNNGLEISAISDTGVLPALPLSRVAASIGRKIAFQKGYRFKRALKEDTAAKIEAMYYDIGREAIHRLEVQGYAKIQDNVPTIMDYQSKADLKKDFPKNDKTRSDVLSVSLDEKKLKIGTNSTEADYFLNRTEADLTDTDLGVITEKLRMANLVTQPSTIVLPDVAATKTDEELAQWDDGINSLDDKTASARKAIYEKPLYVNKALHDFLKLMNQETLNTGKSATKRINEVFGTRKNMVKSLFGLKRSDDFSIDKKESVAGQNLSKTTPLDDLVEYYDLLQSEGNPAPLHMQMKIGRNGRLYYVNSVLNPHASKQSRYMLTPGEYTLDSSGPDFDYLVYALSQSLKTKKNGNTPARQFTYKEILSSPEVDAAIAAYDKFQAAPTLVKKMQAMGPLAKQFQGIDYVTMLTALQGVKDVRTPQGGKVTTEFAVSADATASGGTLTFLQALGTNTNVTQFLQRIGLLHSSDSLVKQDLNDLYGLMSNSIKDFVSGDSDGLGADIGGVDVTGILQQTLNLLFDEGKDIRELSKDPTMVFIYGQGKNSATDTIARSLADRIIDNLDDPSTREYLSVLFDDKEYKKLEGNKLKAEKGLYKDIVDRLKSTELPQQMYDIMKENISDEYLSEYNTRSQKVYEFAKKLPADTPLKILPAGAVLDGRKATKADLEKYGMPITKKVEVLNHFKGSPDTVLTRREKLQKTVMDVSTIHGTDSAMLYHSLDDVSPASGVVVVHDDIRGNVSTVRSTEAAYVKTAIDVASKYDVHQQVMDAVAAYSPEIAASSEFKTLKAQIDENVAEKKKIISALFNEDSDALIGDGTAFDTFKKSSAAEPGDSANRTNETPALPETNEAGSASFAPEQDFGDKLLTISDGDETVEVLAQEYWNSIQSRLNMVEQLKTCLTS